MRIFQVSLRRFRGFQDLTFQPRDHVALIGEPRAGRSDLIEGLRRVLTSDGVRTTTPSELDLWMLDESQRAEVEVVLGDLGPDLEQAFLDHLEAWDPEMKALAEPKPPTQAVAIDDTNWVLRLCYRIDWDPDQEQAIHWVDFPDESDPDSDTYARVPRRLHDLVPVVVVHSRGGPLRLGPRSDFRRILEAADGGTLGAAFAALVDAVTNAGDAFAKVADIKAAVAEVIKPVEGPLGVDATGDDLVQFVPEGGSLSGILRTLQPALDLGEPGHLPLHRHGATTAALLQAGEAVAAIGTEHAVVLIDDFGEDLDSISARHLTSVFRQRAGQGWISTRRAAAVESFPPQELVRLHVKDGNRRAAQIEAPTTKAERVAARHLSVQLLPAASAAVVAIVEGPHDRAALDAIADQLSRTANKPLPAAHGIAIIDAGVADGSGGAPAVARLASLATRLGFHTIGVIDGDRGDDGAAYLTSVTAAADRVIRLPDGSAIERALIEGLSDTVLISTLQAVCDTFDIIAPAGLETQAGPVLLKSVVGILKKNGGLHAQFIELLPPETTLPVLRAILDAIIDSGDNRLNGVHQL
jgi:putative ATP-dependent endonuclease of OLD family